MSGSGGILSSLISRFGPQSVVTISGVTADDAGNIDLVSPDDSVEIEAIGSGQHEVRFVVARGNGSGTDGDEAAGDVESRVVELEARLDAIDQYLIERSFRVVAQEYESVSRRFDLHAARSVVGGAVNALRDVRDQQTDADAYAEAIEEFIQPQREIIEELEGRVPPRDVTIVNEGLDELEGLVQEEPDAFEIARTQIHVAEYFDVFLDPPRIE